MAKLKSWERAKYRGVKQTEEEERKAGESPEITSLRIMSSHVDKQHVHGLILEPILEVPHSIEYGAGLSGEEVAMQWIADVAM